MTVRTALAGWLLGKELRGQIAQAIEVTTSRAAPRRGTAELMAMYRVSPWFQAVTKKIAQRFASVQWQLYAHGSEGKWSPNHHKTVLALKRASHDNREAMIARFKQAGELQQIEDHPLLDMLTNANPLMTGSAARMLTQLYRDIPGEAFWILGFNAAGKPDQFWPIPPNWVSEIAVGGPESTYMLVVEGQRYAIPKEGVIWFRDVDPANPYGRGVGTAESLTDEIETDEYAAGFIKTFFKNRARPELIISMKGLDEKQLTEAKRRFENQHVGFERSHRSWWHNAEVSVQELTTKFTDMELSDLRKDERDAIINVFGVPPEQMGIVTSSNRATARESENIMATSVLVPRLEPFREQLQAELVPLYDDRLILSYVSPIPADREFQLEVLKAAPYMATRGEWRTMGGLPDRGEGDDVHLMPLNLYSEPAPVADLSGVSNAGLLLPAHKAAITSAGITHVLEALRPVTIVEEVEPLWEREVEDWGTQALFELGLDARFNMQNPLVVDHMRKVTGERIPGINETTRKRIQAELIEGMQAGEGYQDLAKRLSTEFDFLDRVRAERIARTETVHSAAFAEVEAYTQSGIVEKKRWLVTPDGQRHDLAGYGGITADVRSDFEFADGDHAPYPGGFADVGQNVNCRCAVAPVVESEKEAPSRDAMDRQWKAKDADRLAWENSAKAAYRRAFKKQEGMALDALKTATA